MCRLLEVFPFKRLPAKKTESYFFPLKETVSFKGFDSFKGIRRLKGIAGIRTACPALFQTNLP